MAMQRGSTCRELRVVLMLKLALPGDHAEHPDLRNRFAVD
jgi:hypothetical protein